MKKNPGILRTTWGETSTWDEIQVMCWFPGTFPRLFHQVLCLTAQPCPTVCDPMDCSPPDSSVHGILQARILEWMAMLCSRESFPTQVSNPGLPHCRILYGRSHQAIIRGL